jgi:hypothetical protein
MRRTLLPLLVLIGAACSDLLPPPGVDPYEYRVFVPTTGGTTPLAFRWPRARLPIRVYVADDNPLRPALLGAIDTWEGAFVYGEVRAVLTPDSTTADVIVRNEVAVKLQSRFRLAGSADGCLGSTDFEADPESGILVPPFRVRVWSLTAPTNPGLAACYEATVLHEIGHALGIFAHSPDAGDVMNVNPTRTTLSARDKATIEAVYHLPVTLRPTN